MRLYGRRFECERLDQLVAAVQTERRSGSVLILRGEAGIGKTALLEHTRSSAAGCRVAPAAGVQSEMELAFGGLHQLCAPFLDRLHRLPQPRREALETAFGLSAGPPPDRFLVGLAVLGLLADVAEQEPLVCLIDDAQWLDQVSAQTLAFVARRLCAERIGLVLAVRESGLRQELAGLPRLEVGRLSDVDARALLDSVTPGRLDRRVRDRIVAEARGNPLDLLEMPRGSTPAELAAGYGGPHPAWAGRIEPSFLRRVESLPAQTRQLLLVAAAEPVGDVALLTRAAQLLGIDETAAGPARSAGLITIGTRVRFLHPLARSAAYRAATAEDRQRAHRALADAIDPRADPERRAWHLANATAAPDETVAAELARSAERAQSRSGVAAAAAFLERAAELTPDPARRGGRALAAARAKYRAGGYDAALELLDAAMLSPLDDHDRARAGLLRGQIVFAATSAGAALPLLLDAAATLEPLDPGLARESYRDALLALITAGRLPGGPAMADVARAALAAPAGPAPERDDLLLNGLALIATEGYAAGVPLVRRALDAFRSADEVSEEEGLTWFPFACRLAHNVWDFDNWSVLSARLVDLARETGVLSVLPSALLQLVSNRALAGELAEADALAAEAQAIGEVMGTRFMARYAALLFEPWRGRETETRQAIEAVRREAVLQGEGKVETATQWASAVLYNGLGRYEEAYAAAERASEHPQELGGPYIRSLIELVESAARSGRPARAAQAAARLHELALVSGTDWALGTSASLRAQVSAGPAAEALFGEAIERLGRTEARIAQARARLLYGEWLRRENRRPDAREQLSAAYEMFCRMGAEGFTERARRELQAIGEKVGRRPARPATTLTAQESQIARLAGDGLTNLEIGAQLFISPHTVEWHLRKVFAKLGIASRRQIPASLLQDAVA